MDRFFTALQRVIVLMVASFVLSSSLDPKRLWEHITSLPRWLYHSLQKIYCRLLYARQVAQISRNLRLSPTDVWKTLDGMVESGQHPSQAIRMLRLKGEL